MAEESELWTIMEIQVALLRVKPNDIVVFNFSDEKQFTPNEHEAFKKIADQLKRTHGITAICTQGCDLSVVRKVPSDAELN